MLGVYRFECMMEIWCYTFKYRNTDWYIHANPRLQPNLTTRLTQNTDRAQTNSLVSGDNRTATLWSPIWRMMATPSSNVPSYKTFSIIDWETSLSAGLLYSQFNCWLDTSLFASLFYNHQTTGQWYLEVLLNIIQQYNTSYWYI